MGLGVGHVGAVLLVLAGIGEVDAVGVDVAALAGEAQVGADAHVSAEADDDVLEDAAATDLDPVVGGMDGLVLPALDGHQGELGAVGDRHLDALGQGGGAGVVQDDGSLGTGLGGDEDVLGGGAGELCVLADDVQSGGPLQLGAGLQREHGGGLCAVPGGDAGTVDRGTHGADAGVAARDRLQAHAVGQVRLDTDTGIALAGGGRADGVEVEQRSEALHRREAPLLLTAARHRDVGGVEGGGAVGARGDIARPAVGVGAVERGARVVGREFRHVEVLLGRQQAGVMRCGSKAEWADEGGSAAVGQPTEFSICSSMSRLSSRAYSMGSSRAMGSTKPRTIVAMASVSVRPRCMR